MCTVSMIMDHYIHQPKHRWTDPYFIDQFKDLFERAKKYDEDNNEPDCELDEKRQALKKIADEMGVEIKFL